MKKLVSVLLALAMCLTVSIPTVASGNTAKSSNEIIYDYVEYLNRGDYAGICTLICDSKRAEYELFIQNERNIKKHLGLFNYKSASLVSMKPYNGDAFSLDECEDTSNLCFWECIINVETYEDNEFLTSGLNYFIIATGRNTAGEIHILEIMRDIRETAALCGEYMSEPASYDAPVSAPSSGVWSTPSTIQVYMEETKTVKPVGFLDYCYVVTANEFGTDSYNDTARCAVAMAIKNFGWNRILVQKYPNLGYHVKNTTDDQVYNTGKTVTQKVKDAVDTIWDYVMLSCDYKLFCGFHVASSSVNKNAAYHGGILSQTEANTLAKNGYTWENILHYFYDYGTYNSEMKSGIIKIVSLSHSSIGKTYSYDIYAHWITCATCGCIHTKSAHNWVKLDNLGGGLYECTICHMTSSYIPTVLNGEADEKGESDDI